MCFLNRESFSREEFPERDAETEIDPPGAHGLVTLRCEIQRNEE